MQAPIDSVRRGLARFTDQIIERDIDARYMIVLFGLFPEIILDWVDDGYVCRDGLAQVRAAEINNFQGPSFQGPFDATEFVTNVPRWLSHENHDCVDCNTREASFETMHMILNTAKGRNLIHRRNDSLSAQQSGVVRFRPDAEKFFIHVTNEDNDCPWYAENQLVDATKTGGRSAPPEGRACGKGQTENVIESGTQFSPPSPFPLSKTGDIGDLWMDEVENIANAIVDNNVSLYMFINPGDGQSRRQFGNPTYSVQNADLSGFNATATRAQYANDTNVRNSFIGRIMQKRLNATVRLFDIAQISNAKFVDNFFRQIVQEVLPDCFMEKRQSADQMLQPECFDYRCRCDVGCVATPLDKSHDESSMRVVLVAAAFMLSSAATLLVSMILLIVGKKAQPRATDIDARDPESELAVDAKRRSMSVSASASAEQSIDDGETETEHIADSSSASTSTSSFRPLPLSNANARLSFSLSETATLVEED